MIEKLLSQLSNNYLELLTKFGYGLCICDDKLNVLWFNENFLSWFSPKENQTLHSLIEEKEKIENSIIYNSINLENLNRIEVQKPSSRKWFMLNVSELTSEETGNKYLFFLLDDTTERKQVFENFISQLEILDNVEDGIYSTDFDNKIIYWNKGAEKIYGYSSQEVSGKIVNKDFILYEPLDAETQIQIVQELEKYRTYYFRRKEFRKDGYEIWIEGNVTLISDTGDKPIGLIYIVRDITGKLISETLNTLNANLQKSLREITANLLADTNFSDILLQFTKKCKELTESSVCAVIKSTEHKSEIIEVQSDKSLSEDELINLISNAFAIRSWLELNKTNLVSFENSAPEIIEMVKRIFKVREFIIAPVIIKNNIDYFIIIGSDNYLLTKYKTEILNSFASLLSFIISYFDKKILQETLEDKIKQIQKFELTSNLITGIVHDFKNLLNGIQTIVDLIKTKHSDSIPQKLIEELEVLLTHGLELSKSLLEIGKPLKPAKTKFKLQKLLNEIYNLAIRICPPNIKIEKDYDDLPEVYADYSQLHQVFMNLIVNARDAMPDGGTIKIYTELILVTEKDFIINPKIKPGTYIVINISDTGIGIPKENIQKIFEPYFTTKDTKSGTGLGLFISQNIINRHNGFIDVESEIGKGTTFKVHLPISFEEDTIKDVEVHQVIKSKPTILLVDDEVSIRSLLSEMLSFQNFDVLEAASCDEAINLFEKHKDEIDLIVMDYFLKDSTSVDAIRWVKDKNPNLPIFVATGLLEEKLIEKLNELKVDKIIEKPYEFDTLLTSINNYIKIAT
ncbi:MAG: ATP-binding protein [Ignavibacteria bacterium]|nr:ATP-binding protein [Ignavibacteria bacterium]